MLVGLFTKGDQVKHMFVSLGGINFGELFTLGLLHVARYMRLIKGDNVKHPPVVHIIVGSTHMPIVYRSP